MSMVAGIRALLLLPACMYGFRVARSDGAATNEATSACGFTTRPVQKSIGGGYRSFVYTEPYRASLFRNGLLLKDTAFQQYDRWLQTTMARNFGDVVPYNNQTALLIRQRGVFEGIGRDTRAWDAMLGGRVGAISASNCIESALWAKQNEYHPLMEMQREFGAYILLDRANTTVKVYLQTGPGYGVKALTWAFSSIDRDLRNGFKILTFLHNHPFFPEGRYDCGGTCIPSDPDLRSFANGKHTKDAQEWWITNGYDSFRLPRKELGKFPTANRELEMAQMERPEGSLDALLEQRAEQA